MKGKTLRKNFEDTLSTETSVLQELNQQHASLTQAGLRLVTERKIIMRSLAKIYLSTSNAWEKMRDRFDKISQKIDHILAERREENAKLLESQKELEEKLKSAGKTISTEDRNLSMGKATVIGLKQAVFDYLGAAFTQKARSVEEANALVLQDEKRLDRITHDCEEKLIPFQNSKLFMYLLNRSSQGHFELKGLDKWIAKVVHFQDNLASWSILTQLPGHVKKANDDRVVGRIIAQSDLDKEWKAGADHIGLTDAEATYEATKEKLTKLHEKKQQIEAKLRKVAADIESFNEGSDEYLEGAQAELEELLGDHTLDALHKLAKSTKDPQDDALVKRLYEIEAGLDTLKEKLAAATAAVKTQEDKTSRVEKTLQQIKRKNLDSSRSRIDLEDVALGALIGALLNDDASPSTVLGKIEREHRMEAPAPAWTPSSYSGSSSSSSSSSSSWGSSGGFGGGGFSSGSDFGGGGFSTGGDF